MLHSSQAPGDLQLALSLSLLLSFVIIIIIICYHLSSQAPGDLQLALRGGGDRGGRVGGRQAGLAGQVPAH